MKSFLSIIFIISLAFCVQSKVLTYEDIVSKIYDLQELAVLPEKGENGALFSSYERSSRYDEKSDAYLRWEANDDGRGIVRKEGEYAVLADIKGPGVIWRMWSATVKSGKVEIYLDGKLVIDLPWEDYFNRKVAPFNRKGLVYSAAKGWNNYTPISFQKSCKIMTKGKTSGTNAWGKYFHFNYTVFPNDTIVQTFKMELSTEENKALDKVNEIMTTGLGENPTTYTNAKKKILSWEIPAGKSMSLAITGKQAITSLKIKSLVMGMTDSSPLRPEASKGVRCQVSEDGRQKTEDREKVSGVRCQVSEDKKIPLTPFKKGGINPIIHKSNNPNLFEFYSYWYMPFQSNAIITIKNETDKNQKIILIVEHAPLETSFDNLGYFHAKWHHNLETNPKRPLDWLILKTKGRGRFVGFALHIWNPGGGWWGEGDEKFFIDGEKFPSTYGTGSEDYFGYAWCSAHEFSKPFHSQPTNSNNKGHISNNRWQIGDNIPFQKSFEADMEKYFKNERPTLFFGVAYWYLSKNGIDYLKPLPENEITITYPIYVPALVEGAIEYNGPRWSGDEQLFWTGAKPGDYLEVEINSSENIEKNLVGQVARNNDYAIIQFYFNGGKIGKEFDCYRSGLKVSYKTNFGKVKLKKGKNILKIEIIGANPKAKKLYNLGLDYFKFE